MTADDLKDIYPAMLDMARDPKDDTLISFPLGGEGVVLVYNADSLARQQLLHAAQFVAVVQGNLRSA